MNINVKINVMLRKQKLHDKVVSLRKKGLSYNEILSSVFVSQSTLSRWCHNVKLTEKQKNRINDKKRNNPFIKNLIETSIRNKEIDKQWAENIIKQINISESNLLVIGIMLYWAEGYNSKSNYSAGFTNTDPYMIKIMMKFFRNILSTNEEKIKIMVRIGEGGDSIRAKNYWSKITGVSLDRFQKTEILKLKEGSRSLERCPNGMCRVSIYDVKIKRKIGNLIDLIKEKSSPHSSVG